MSEKFGTSFEINIFLVPFRISSEWALNTYLNAHTSSSVYWSWGWAESLLLLVCLPDPLFGSVVCPLLKMVSRVWLCDPIDCSLPGSSVHGLLQARVLEWVAYPFSSWSLQPRKQNRISCIAGGFFTSWATREAIGCYKILNIAAYAIQ